MNLTPDDRVVPLKAQQGEVGFEPVGVRPTQRDRGAAKQLAEEVRGSEGRRRTWRKVTTLLSHFGVHRLTPAVRERISESLNDAGLEVEPPLSEVSRSGTVRLALADADDQPIPATGPVVDRDTETEDLGSVDVTYWQAGMLRQAGLMQGPRPGEIAWYDVDILRGSERAVWKALRSHCEGLSEAMVADLFDADDVPGVDSMGQRREVRAVSITEVSEAQGDRSPAVSRQNPDASQAGEGPELEFSLVELLVGDGWLISAWHEGQVQAGATPLKGERPAPKRASGIREKIAREWSRGTYGSAGDLGTLVIREMAVSYANAYRYLYSWLDTWDQAFSSEKGVPPVSILTGIRALTATFRKQLTGLDTPGADPRSAWFSNLTEDAYEPARQVEVLVSNTLRELRDLAREVQDRTLDVERTRNDRFQVLVATAGGLVLVPTLVASIFGANTSLPGEESWTGFFLLIGVMLVSMVATALGLKRWHKRHGSSRPSPGSSDDA